MKTVAPYLTFPGTAREAFDFYKQVLGGEFTAFVKMSEIDCGPDAPPMPEDLVGHIALPYGNSVIMGSDAMEGYGPPLVEGTNFSVSLTVESREEADRVFTGLSADGTAAMPMGDAPWGDYFGMLVDKFNIQWMISYPNQNN